MSFALLVSRTLTHTHIQCPAVNVAMPLQKLTSVLDDNSGSAAGQTPASGSLFGSTQQPANASAPKPGGLFGTTPQQPPQQGTSLFGSASTAAASQPQQTALVICS